MQIHLARFRPFALVAILECLCVQAISQPPINSDFFKASITVPKLQYNFSSGQGGDVTRLQQVRSTINDTWNLYVQHAWGYDEIQPVTGDGINTFDGWGATIVDSLDTLYIARLYPSLASALNFTASINFTSADGSVSTFETIIRFVGGLVTICDLLDFGPDLRVGNLSRYVPQMRGQAEILASKLAPGLDTPSGFWLPQINFSSENQVSDGITTSPAQTGTNILEYGRLSERTGDLQYLENATKSWWPLLELQLSSVLPGIVPQPLSVNTGQPTGANLQWGGGEDSFLEYLIKSFILWPNNETLIYQDQWILALENTMQRLASWSLPTTNYPSYQYLAIYINDEKLNQMEHLTCFAPGNFLLGGRALNRDDIFEFGLNVIEGCRHAYNATPSGIAPEVWAWQSNDTITNFPSDNASSQWDSFALWSIDSDYYLRPETMESFFYAYRLTGNKTYQDWAWDAFQHIVAATKAPFGFSSITDVMASEGGSKSNQQQSFFLAETLKISLDEWVFNTEAHPLKRGPKFTQVKFNNLTSVLDR